MAARNNHLNSKGLAGIDRRDFLKYAAAVSAAAGITAALSACSSPSGQPTPASGSLGSSSGPPTSSSAPAGGAAKPEGQINCSLAFALASGFDPMNASDAVATCVNQHIFEALVDLDPVTREPYLALAAAEPTSSADGLTWTVAIREGAKFSDGTDLTAEDVAWSFMRCIDPANDALMASFVPFLDSASATDAKTVEFKLKEPFSLFPERISVVKIVPKAKTADAAASKTFDSAPIGSGPFKIDSVNETTGVVVSFNQNYNGPRPARVATVNFRTTQDNQARLNDLRGGQSLAVEAVPYLDVATLEGGEYQVDTQQAFNCLFLMFNCAAKPFDDKRVRQALFYAIDTEKVIATALQGYGSAATSYLYETNPNYQRASTVYGYDPDKARSLLQEAGVTDLSFEFVTTSVGFIADCAPVIVSSWKDIGVNATLNTTSGVYANIVPQDSFRVLAASGDPTIYGTDADLLLRWYYYGATWPTDRMRWTTPSAKQCADLLDEAAEQPADQQKATWKQIFDLVADEVPLYPVLHTQNVTGSSPEKLDGFKGAPTTGLYFLNVGRKG